MKRLTYLVNPGNVGTARNVLMKTIQAQPITVEATKSYLVAKFNDMNTFYKHLTGINELEYYQDRVIELQDSLTDAQLKRRELSYILNDVRNKSIAIQDRLHKVKRHEDPAHFLELMREETDFLKQERELFTSLKEQERYERDVFSALTNAIRDSQEKQRNRLEYAKYIGFGLTLLGALGSYLITTWRTQDLKTVIRGSIQEDVKSALGDVAKDSAFLMQQMAKQQEASQSKDLHAFFAKLLGVIEQNKKTNEQQFQDGGGTGGPVVAETTRPTDAGWTDWTVIKWIGLALGCVSVLSLFGGGR